MEKPSVKREALSAIVAVLLLVGLGLFMMVRAFGWPQ